MRRGLAATWELQCPEKNTEAVILRWWWWTLVLLSFLQTSFIRQLGDPIWHVFFPFWDSPQGISSHRRGYLATKSGNCAVWFAGRANVETDVVSARAIRPGLARAAI